MAIFVAPYVPTYAATQPYATAAEFNAYPTGVNAMEIVPGASQAVLSDTLAQLLIEASSEADGICNQVLACTTEVEYGRRRVNAAGNLNIPTNQFPIVEVDAVTAGPTGGTPMILDPSKGWLENRNVFAIPYAGLTDSGYGSGSVMAQITYLAGYANALTMATASQGATALVVNSVLGMQPGMTLRVYDPGVSENVTVASVSGQTVTLTGPLANAHQVGVGVSALPAAIREAVILLTAVKIKAKASQATVFPGIPSGQPAGHADPSGEQFEAAMDLLNPYIRV